MAKRNADKADMGDHAALIHAASQAAALCTIVGIDGSFSRRRGAQLAVGRDGSRAGDMADNCLDAELANQATEAFQTGEVKLLRYGRGSPFIDFRLPCGSGLDILIDPAPDRTLLARCVQDLEARRETSLSLPVPVGKQMGLMHERSYIPALRLLILGSGPECAALQRLAAAQHIGCEWREAGRKLSLNQVPPDLKADRWTAIILLFHDHEWEHALIEWALGTSSFYIGAQGGAPARSERVERLKASGHGEGEIARLRSPIGLIHHARDPGVLALSILAEVVGAYEGLHPHR